MAKEIRVHLYRNENDDYVELWKVFDEKKYYGRYTYNDWGTWYYVSDPLGYCELDHQVPNDITFVCCDVNGKEQCRYSNADPNPLVKFETYVKRKWSQYKKKVQANEENFEKEFWSMCWDATTTYKINKWLLSFKDPELYGDVARDYDENWYGCWKCHEIAYEPLEGSEFTYLGNKYQFTKVTKKHDICGVEWDEYYCTDAPYIMSDFANEDRPWIETYMYLGNWFDDSKYGTMYDKATAIQKVKNGLKDIYKGEMISKIYSSYGFTYEKFFSYHDAAEELLKRDYNIERVTKLIRDEADNPSFEIVSDPSIEERYPKIQRDHTYNYHFGIKWTA